MPITTKGDVLSVLTSPGGKAREDMVQELASRGDSLFCGLYGIIKQLLHFDPIEDWVVKTLSGDWDALKTGAEAWEKSGQALTQMADNVGDIQNQLADRWEGGQAPAQFAQQLSELVNALEACQPLMDEIGEALVRASEAAKALGDVIWSALQYLSDIATIVLADQMIPPPGGQIVGGATLAAAIPKAARMAFDVQKAITAVLKVVQAAVAAMQSLVHMEETIRQAEARFTAGLSGGMPGPSQGGGAGSGGPGSPHDAGGGGGGISTGSW